jgi:hypothetical protein
VGVEASGRQDHEAVELTIGRIRALQNAGCDPANNTPSIFLATPGAIWADSIGVEFVPGVGHWEIIIMYFLFVACVFQNPDLNFEIG